MDNTRYIDTDETVRLPRQGMGWSAEPEMVEYPVKLKREGHPPKLVKFGAEGHSVEYGRYEWGSGHYATCTGSGYETPESFFAVSRWPYHDFADRQDPEQFEGVPYIDVRAAVETSAGIHMSISGPMVNVDLQDDEVARCPEPSRVLAGALMTDPGNTYGGLLAIQESQRSQGAKYGALDSVSTRVYMELWKAAGATVGYIRNGEFVPED